MPKKPSYHKSQKACIKCPDCNKKVYGISKAQAQTNMIEHKHSNHHKIIVKAIKEKVASHALIINKDGVVK